ncbi:glycosyltransferase [Actinotalea sp. JY-7876]|uniref:glycosyltransferase n=2 Tax=unclassified Actinotalea TaxID=2638618 RepID=UPI0021038E19|nr:glycosyltransferase [Actinotalea sp. JY-7876]
MTLDTITDRMAGPAIRAWEISRALATEHDVRLVTFGRCTRSGEGFDVRQIGVGDFRAEVEASDVVVIQGFVFNAFPWLQTCEQVLVVDLYDPFQLETLEVDRYKPEAARNQALAFALGELSDQVRRGDLFLCASRRQRDLWIGQLAAAGRINPDTYDADPSLRSLITIVPFGTAPEPPVQARRAIKGTVRGIGVDDKVVLWGGGVYNWFDPLSLVRAVDRLKETVPEVRLFFLGMKHPNPDVPEMAVATRCRELSDELGLTGRHVFFNEDWVPYESRADHLLDADVGVSCHFPHVETEFSFRTRILDYLWAGLPIVATQGDSFAELIEARGLGRTVPAEDVDALVEALEAMLTDERARGAARAAVREVAAGFTWPVVLEPLVQFCREPRRAADAHRLTAAAHAAPVPRPPRLQQVRQDARAAVRHLRDGGVRQVVAKIRWRLARRS